jgi:hypothetical protein
LIERLGILFSDGSISVLPEGTTLEAAKKEAEEHDQGDLSGTTRVLRMKIEISEIPEL